MSKKIRWLITMMLLLLTITTFAQDATSGKSFVQSASEERL